MEIFGLFNAPTWLIAIIALFTAAYIYTKRKHSFWWKLGVPGPKPTPFLGYLGKLKNTAFYAFDMKMRKEYGKFVGLYHGHSPCFLTFDADAAKQVCVKDFSSFPNRFSFIRPMRGFETMLTTVKDDHWKFLRNTMTPTFSSGKMRNMNPFIQKCYDTLLQNFDDRSKDGKPVEVTELFGGYTMDVIASTAFGLEIDSQKDTNNEFIKKAKAVFSVGLNSPLVMIQIIFPGLGNILSRLNIAPKASRELLSYFKATIVSAIESRTKADKTRKDFLQLMLNAHKDTASEADLIEYKGDPEKWKDRGLTLDEITANSILFFLAGYETTANTLSFTAYCLAIYPDLQDKVLEEIDRMIGKEKPDYDKVQKLQYLEMFVSEVLRLYSPATRTNRQAERDVEIGGYKIPKGTDVSIGIHVIHRDPEYWEDPDKFNPDRFTPETKAKRHPYAYLPFGLGPRSCIAMRFALLELKCAIVNILQKYRLVRCEETEVPLKLAKRALLKAENGIKLKLELR